MTVWSEERMERAATMWREGYSSGEIVVALGGVTRSALLGIMNRHRDLFPLRGRGGRPGPRPKSDRPAENVASRRPRTPAPQQKAAKPLPPRPVPASAPTGPQRPFLEAATRDLRLFFAGPAYAASGPDMPVCGAPRVTGRYCAHHAQRATQAGHELQESGA